LAYWVAIAALISFMRETTSFEKIDLHLIRVLHTVIAERSVSRAAVRLGMHQPAVSTALKRLRDLSGDPILVRSGSGMQPTDAALRMLEPSADILQAAENLFTEARSFDPRSAARTFRIAASDYLDPLFLPKLVAHLKKYAPLCTVEIMALSHDVDYSGQLAHGDVDVVIGNWPQPPAELRMAQLFADDDGVRQPNAAVDGLVLQLGLPLRVHHALAQHHGASAAVAFAAAFFGARAMQVFAQYFQQSPLRGNVVQRHGLTAAQKVERS